MLFLAIIQISWTFIKEIFLWIINKEREKANERKRRKISERKYEKQISSEMTANLKVGALHSKKFIPFVRKRRAETFNIFHTFLSTFFIFIYVVVCIICVITITPLFMRFSCENVINEIDGIIYCWRWSELWAQLGSRHSRARRQNF